MSEEAISREEQRLIKSMAHARVAQPTRPRSWSLKASPSLEFNDQGQPIEKAESKPVPQQPVHTHPVHPAHVHPAHPAHNPAQQNYQPDQAQHAQSKGILSVELPVYERQEEVKKVAPPPEQEVRKLTPEEEEEKKREAERQAKMEQERFARYLGKGSAHSRSPSAGVSPSPAMNSPSFNTPTNFNSPTISRPVVPSEKSPRQAVMLEISGHGSTKGEAGKQTSFVLKSKSVNMDPNKANLNVTVKITAKNSEGKAVEIDNTVFAENDGYTVSYTPLFIGAHTVDVFVGGHLAHTMAVPVVEGGPIAANTEATWDSLATSSVGNKSQLVVIPKSYINRLVPLGYSNLSAKVEHVDSGTVIKNVSVLGNKEGQYVVSFYPSQPGLHTISVTLNSQHITGSSFDFNVAG